MFSKIKIVHNYFEEFQGDFKELVAKAVSHAEKTTESKDQSLEEKVNKKIKDFQSREKKEQEKWKLSLTESFILTYRHNTAIRKYFAISNDNRVEEKFEEVYVNLEKKLH